MYNDNTEVIKAEYLLYINLGLLQDSLLQTILAVVHLLGIVALALALIIPLALS